MIASRCTVCSSSRRTSLNSSRWRTILIPPPVDPADAPENISSSSVTVASGPQSDVVGGREPGRGQDRRGLEQRVADARLAGLVAAADHLDRRPASSRSAISTRYSRSSSSRASTSKRRCTKNRYSRRKLIPAMTMKIRIRYCVIGANAAIEIVRVEKPPSATTDSDWPTASKIVSSGSRFVQLTKPRIRIATDGQDHVEHPQPPRRLADRVAELLDLGRPGELGLQQLAPADPQPRQDRDGEHDDAHAAEPVAELAPEQHRARQLLDPRHDRGAGRGEAGDRLEVRVERPRELRAAVEDERQRAEDRHQQPDQRDDEEALARRHRGAPLVPGDLVQQRARPRR